MWVSQDKGTYPVKPDSIPVFPVPKVLDIGPREQEQLYVVPAMYALWDDDMKAVEGPIGYTTDGMLLASGMCLGHRARNGTPYLIVRVGQNGRNWMEPIMPGQIPTPESATRSDWGEF